MGGRVFTVYLNGSTGELGGHNITDGGKAPHMLRLIQDLGLELEESHVDLNQFYFNGSSLTSIHQLLNNQHFDQEQLHHKLQELSSRSQTMKEVLKGIVEEDHPLYKAIALRLAAYEGASPELLSPLYVETLFHMLLGEISAAHPTREQGSTQIHIVKVKGGNSLLPEQIGRSLRHRLHLNMPLKGLSKNSNGTFLLSFDHGHQTEADILVLANPCSTYKNILFGEGVIPLEKLTTMQNIRYGTNSKILVPSSSSLTKTKAVMNDHVISFLDIAQNILVLYHTGSSSLFSRNTLDQAYNASKSMIETGFKETQFSLKHPMFAEDRALMSYEGPVGYSWPNDVYAQGSYAYIAPGQEELLTSISQEQGEWVKTLFAPLDQKLYFAGEHASILMDTPGTMEAACESGERTARLIIRSFNEQKI